MTRGTQRGQPNCDVHVYKSGDFVKTIHRKVILAPAIIDRETRTAYRGGFLVRYEKQWRRCKVVPNTLGTYRLDL